MTYPSIDSVFHPAIETPMWCGDDHFCPLDTVPAKRKAALVNRCSHPGSGQEVQSVLWPSLLRFLQGL